MKFLPFSSVPHHKTEKQKHMKRLHEVSSVLTQNHFNVGLSQEASHVQNISVQGQRAITTLSSYSHFTYNEGDTFEFSAFKLWTIFSLSYTIVQAPFFAYVTSQ